MPDWQALCARLRRFDTPTICNVLELFGVRPQISGFTDKSIRAAFPALPPMVGFAATATCCASSPREEGEASISLADQIRRFGELSGPAVVVLQDISQPQLAATFGEVMCTAYRAFGAVGLVTNGAGRDLDHIARLRFPVFSDGIVASHGYFHLVDLHVTTQIGGMVVSPDDLIHADLNGLTVIPRDIAERVPDAAAEFVAAEQIILRALRSPDVTLSGLEDALAQAGAKFDALRRRLG